MTAAKSVAKTVACTVAKSAVGGDGGLAISSLFNTSTDGFWFDTSDISTLFQDSSGTTPVLSDSDPVGLVNDKSGFSNQATATGTARPTWDETNGRLVFDGIDDELTFGGTPSAFVTKTQSYTLMGWIAPSSTAVWSLLNIANSATDRHGLLGGSGNVLAGIYNGTAYVGQRADAVYTAGQRIHVAYTHESGSVTLYINGVATNTGTAIGNLGTNNSIGFTNNGNWRLAGTADTVIGLDYVATPEQIAAVYALGR